MIKILKPIYTSKLKKLCPMFLMEQTLPKSQTNSILLTFDDGPDAKITPQVLELLKSFNARAVFFVVGSRITNAPHVLRRIIDEGHLIGNHSFHHYQNQRKFFDFLNDLKKCQDLIYANSGKWAPVFRPPGGRISINSLIIPKMLHLRTVLWSLDGDDWNLRTEHCPQQIANGLMEQLKERDILLLHDNNAKVLHILELLLPAITRLKINMHDAVDVFERHR